MHVFIKCSNLPSISLSGELSKRETMSMVKALLLIYNVVYQLLFTCFMTQTCNIIWYNSMHTQTVYIDIIKKFWHIYCIYDIVFIYNISQNERRIRIKKLFSGFFWYMYLRMLWETVKPFHHFTKWSTRHLMENTDHRLCIKCKMISMYSGYT